MEASEGGAVPSGFGEMGEGVEAWRQLEREGSRLLKVGLEDEAVSLLYLDLYGVESADEEEDVGSVSALESDCSD